MLSFIVDTALIVLGVGGVVTGEVWLRVYRSQEDTRVAREISAGTTAYRRERLADGLREALTKDDVVFLRTNGWDPPVTLRALAAGVQPYAGLEMKAIEPPSPPNPKPQTSKRLVYRDPRKSMKPTYVYDDGDGGFELYDMRGRKIL